MTEMEKILTRDFIDLDVDLIKNFDQDTVEKYKSQIDMSRWQIDKIENMLKYQATQIRKKKRINDKVNKKKQNSIRRSIEVEKSIVDAISAINDKDGWYSIKHIKEDKNIIGTYSEKSGCISDLANRGIIMKEKFKTKDTICGRPKVWIKLVNELE